MNGSSLSRRVALLLLVALLAVPALWSQAPEQKKDERRAYVTVRVHSDATLTVDGKATRLKGARRTFQSPPLEAGKKYTYTFVAKWMPRNNYETYKVTRTATVEAGKSVEIDMSEPKFDQGDTLEI